MLESLYSYFGFTASLVVSLFIFLFFVFWMAGVAGICSRKRPVHRQALFISLAVFIPPYPVVWLISEMIKQKRELRNL
ncbi:MAG: hypothetical protein EA360_08745 [Balneolaceae bacterium]|nr:MAG: hypothetical protein EA360_08745 [Balneolaceae bacterium]